MNQRIRQLAEQAGIGYEKRPELDVWIAFNIDLEKFAQLIVAECMRLNSKELSITAIERLLPLYQEHFGVEE